MHYVVNYSSEYQNGDKILVGLAILSNVQIKTVRILFCFITQELFILHNFIFKFLDNLLIRCIILFTKRC